VARPTVIALGGNAISPPGSAGTAEEQTANIGRSMVQVAELVASGTRELVLTHGNGPQVGNVLVKNEIARDVVPPVPLDWCVAQTQATIGFVIANTLGHELAQRGVSQPVVPVVSRVRVAADDPGWQAPSKPIGGWLTDAADVARRRSEGQDFLAHPDKGWRRLVPSPEPLDCMDRPAIELLLGDGAIVVANGGGGIPVVDDGTGLLHGVEAVIDKDLAGSMLAQQLDARRLLLLTDVPGVALGYGTDRERWLGPTPVTTLRTHLNAGEFGTGSMRPKVEAACRFVERTGGEAVIAALDDLLEAAAGRAGTRVLP
jgi:carbamate kinase